MNGSISQQINQCMSQKPVPVTVEPGVIWGLEWWELICIIFGSILLLLFVCACCCAIIESGNIQRQEVRGPNGERLGFLQAPGEILAREISFLAITDIFERSEVSITH